MTEPTEANPGASDTDRRPRASDGTTIGRLRSVVRWLVLFGGPALAAVAMWTHPHSGDDVYASLLPVADTFLATHVLYFGGVALLSGGLYLLVAGYDDPLASVARFGAAVYAVLMLGFVATVGITSGLLLRESRALAPAKQEGFAHALQYLHTEPLLIAAGALGGLGYLVSVVSIAVVRRRAGDHWAPLALLVSSVVAVGAHSGWAAIAGMGAFVVAVAWLEFRSSPAGTTEADDASPAT